MSDMNSKLNFIIDNIKSYPDFPAPGIVYRDIFSVFAKPEALNVLYELLTDHVETIKGQVQAVCGIESRGFLFGPHIALQLGIPFIPIRKKGKLPGKVEKVSYTLEYGEDVMEVQSDSLKAGTKVLLVDDLLATGGTLSAACKLVNSVGCQVYQCLVFIELEDLEGRERVPAPVHTFTRF